MPSLIAVNKLLLDDVWKVRLCPCGPQRCDRCVAESEKRRRAGESQTAPGVDVCWSRLQPSRKLTLSQSDPSTQPARFTFQNNTIRRLKSTSKSYTQTWFSSVHFLHTRWLVAIIMKLVYTGRWFTSWNTPVSQACDHLKLLHLITDLKLS